SLAWTDERKGSHVARAALSYIWNQVENGTACPTGMNYSALPAIAAVEGIGQAWAPKIVAAAYDPRPVPMQQKAAVTIGMTLTEKQGGSDLRANSTQATPLGGRGPGAAYELTGHKWFCSAPMCDAFYTLAQTANGPTCFLVPRWLPDGTRNRFFIQRLKDKLGNRSNASSEIEYRRTFAWALSEEGKGVRAAIDMIHLTRLDFAVGSAGLMRQALTQALHHTSHRSAFGRRLVDQPLMANVLADLAVDSEASTAMAFRLARAGDEGIRGDKQAALFERIGTSVAKYWNCKRAAGFVHEALECHGGNGFVEEHVMPRLYREAPLNSVWEGSGNVIVLDIARVMKREPDAIQVLLDEIGLACGADTRFDRYFTALKDKLARCEEFESQGRQLVESLALAFQGSMLVRYSTTDVADAFCASRLGGDWGRFFGTLPAGIDFRPIVDRARTL
ncbi:MAG TPA: acyl-CoA dehydrogenase family protein, partial [Lautropia sp.]|nr:acyl-CoA dehydrogenase family protein [Lautropia sp.]